MQDALPIYIFINDRCFTIVLLVDSLSVPEVFSLCYQGLGGHQITSTICTSPHTRIYTQMFM